MSNVKQKILVCGDVNGEFDQLFKRVKSINSSKGPFDLMICLGDFFCDGENEQFMKYKLNTVNVPLDGSVFVLGPTNSGAQKQYSDIMGCNLAQDIVYLGPSGVYTCASGVKIAYLSGFKSTDKKSGGYTNKSVRLLEYEAKEKGPIDILITSQWPSMVDNYVSKPTDVNVAKDGCPLVARLAQAIAPRYHFTAGLNCHYERLPYRNHIVLQEQPKQCTRFMSLASVGNKDKKKWIYAISLTPAKSMPKAELTEQPSDSTECPYSLQKMPPYEDEEQGINKFFYGGAVQGKGSKRSADDDGQRKSKRGPPIPTGPCWFCLSSPEVEKHLVIAIGEHCYLALAKGGIVDDHIMILPINHYQTSLDLEKEASEELEKFMDALMKMFSSKGKVVVFYERNYRTSHLQLHAVPIPKEVMSKVAPTFHQFADDAGYVMDEVPRRTELSAAVRSGEPFLSITTPEGPCLLLRVKKGYNIKFDREVLVSSGLLNMEGRADWRECVEDKETEAMLAQRMKSMMKPYDFTLEEEGSESDLSE